MNRPTQLLNETRVEYGGVDFFLSHLEIYLPYSIVCSLAVIFGLIGNLMVIGSILINKDLRSSSTFILILNLALADLIINLVVDTFSVIGIFVGKRFFDDRMTLCYFVGCVCSMVCFTALMNMLFLAINRYNIIFHPLLYKRFSTLSYSIFYCLLAWIIGFVVNLSNLLGFSDIVYDLKTLTCVFNRLNFTVTLIVALSIILPCLVIGLCYIRIFFRAHIVLSSKKVNKKKLNENIKLAKGLCASFLLYSVCWVPVSIIFLIGHKDDLSITTHLYSILAAHVNSALNPMFYGIYNKKIKNGYKRIFNKIANSNFFYITDSNKQKPCKQYFFKQDF